MSHPQQTNKLANKSVNEEQLKFSSVQIPSLVQRNSNFWLSCQFQLQSVGDSIGDSSSNNGNVHDNELKTTGQAYGGKEDQLYSVKWYKNNEEFYRLIFNPLPNLKESKDSMDSVDGQFKQQYFAQSGVNVMMGSSNATHVRLLNASLESEGLYACEISTQNLSTIRYERDIRVYVPPYSRLNIIGFKNRYSLGDSISLICATDFSRPKPALAWFINGRRITSNDSLFEMELQSRSKLNEPSLLRLTLGLKFKLNTELLSHIKFNQPAKLASTRGYRTLGNQQQQIKITSAGIAGQPHAIELECRYKLTEISDVTYNELSAPRQELTPAGSLLAQTDRKSGGGRSRWSSSSNRLMSSFLGPSHDSSASINQLQVRVHKRVDQQVVQDRSPALARDLWRSMFGERRSSFDACQLGALALLPDDPLIIGVETHSDNAELGSQQSELDLLDRERNSVRQRRWTLPIADERVELDCATMSALQAATPQLDELDNIAKAGRASTFCSEPSARRRLAISGHTQVPGAKESGSGGEVTATAAPTTNQRLRGTQRHKETTNASSFGRTNHALAYLSLGTSSTNNQTSETNINNVTNAESAFFTDGRSQPTASDTTNSLSLLAPPLLEWFINNQEAPRASASYLPELPLSHPSGRRALSNEDDDDAVLDDTMMAPPSIDYTEYFANFDSRPIQQHLSLRLALDKKHFMTPDSKLKLRCSSTQAQVLAVDFVSVTILPTNSNQNQHLLHAWKKLGPAKPTRQASNTNIGRSAAEHGQVLLVNWLAQILILAATTVAMTHIFCLNYVIVVPMS